MMSEPAKGVAAMMGAATIWGLSPLYYKLVVHVPAVEVLSHRMLWSLVFFGAVLALQGRLRDITRALNTPRKFAIVAVASVMISANWALFIWSVQVGRTTETSLGYYIYPLVAVVIGRVIFAELLSRVQWIARVIFAELLSRVQWIAVGLAALAVVVLSVGSGTTPWVALTLAATFGLYGLIKKQLDVGPVASVSAEVLLLVPFAAAILLQTYHNGGAVMGGDLSTMLLLVLAGPVTAVPLILFSYAARRLAMATIGLLQYINPTLQFCCAIFVFSEPFGRWHLIAFLLIWTALALYSATALRQDNARRKAAKVLAASGTAV